MTGLEVEATDRATAPPTRVNRSISWRRRMAVAATVGLGEPRLWPFALVTFLLRGGFFLYLLPIVVVPSTVALATWIGPTAITPAGPSERFVAIVAGAVIVAVTWLVGGGLVAAAAEVVLIRRGLGLALGEDDSEAEGSEPGRRRPGGLGLSARVLLVRLVATTPLVLVAAWGIPRVVAAAYHQLTSPIDTAAPLPFRVLGEVPDVLVAVFFGWLISETIGALATRRLVLRGDRGPTALLMAIGHMVRRPLTTAGTIVVTLAESLLFIVPGLVAAALAWDRLWGIVVGNDPIACVLGLTVLFVAIWAGALVLAGAAGAWRSVAWTLEVVRERDPKMLSPGLAPASDALRSSQENKRP